MGPDGLDAGSAWQKIARFSNKMRFARAATAGFDYLRIGLALAMFAWRSIVLSTGSTALDEAPLWSGPFLKPWRPSGIWPPILQDPE
jgi:hypothetical protein